MGPAQHELEVLSQVITWLVGPVSLAVAAATYARQWPTSYRRATGWTLAVLGALLAVSSSGWIAIAHLWTSTGRGVVLAATGVAGLALAMTGLVRAARAPVDPDVETLRAIASAVESQVHRLNEKDSFDENHFISISIRRSPNYSGRKISLSRSLPRVRSQLIGLIGESGAGKTISLRHLTLQICRDVKRRRHPELIALYVDLAAFNDPPDTITADQIYSYVKDVIATGNTTLSDHFARHVREPRDRPEWIILFDSFDVLLQSVTSDRRDEAARRYLDAIRQFLSSTGPNFRGIIACRESRFVESLGGSVVIAAPLSWHQIAAFSRRIGLDPVVRHQLLQQLHHNLDLTQTIRNPMLLKFLCDRLRLSPGSEFPSTQDEIVRAATVARVEGGIESSVTSEVLRVAEQIAYYLSAEVGPNGTYSCDDIMGALRSSPETGANPEAAVQEIIRAGIVRSDRPQILVFAHSCYHEYFAACWIIRSWKSHDLRRLAVNPLWRAALITALQSGQADLQDALIRVFAGVLADEAEMDPSVLKTVEQFTAIDPTEPLPPMPSVSFIWPRTALRILKILASGLRHEPEMLPPGIKNNADRLIVSAFAAGVLLDQQQAVEISAMSTTEVCLWAVQRALASRSGLLQRAAARQLVGIPRVFTRLNHKARVTAIASAAIDPVISDQAFGKPEDGAPFGGTLVGLLRYLITVGQVTAWVLAAYAIKGLIGDLIGIPEWHPNEVPPGLAFWPLLIMVAVLFLACWTGRRRGPVSLSFLAAAVLACIAGVAALVGIIKLIAAIFFITVGGPFQSVVAEGLAAYVLTWPTSMVARIFQAPSPVPRDWAFPQGAAIRLGISGISSGYRDYLRRRSSGASKSTWRNGPPELLLEWLGEARSTTETEKILRSLTNSQISLNRASVNILRDLARALEWVSRMVPVRTTTVIPPGIWDLGPRFSSPNFDDWLRQFDKRHPGRLSWLALNHREEIARALGRADSQNV